MKIDEAQSSTDRLRACGAYGLDDKSSPDAFAAVLRNWGASLNGADPLRVQAERAEFKKLGFSVAMVDAAIATYVAGATSDNGQGTMIVLADPERWPEPVNGPEVAAELVRTIQRYIALPPGGYTAVALWIMHAHAHDAFQVSPILALLSPTKQCGKSRLFDVLAALTPRSLVTSDLGPATLFRLIDKRRPTLLLDEFDAFGKGNEHLRAILNSGHARGGAWTHRCEGDDNEVRTFSTWTPKSIAAIGRLSATLEDRSIIVRMRRRRPDEPIDRFRLDRAHRYEPLRRQTWTWAQDNIQELRDADPDLPDELSDRGRDNWRCMVGIGDLLGGLWPERAREAARLITSLEPEQENSYAVQMIEDVVAMFSEKGVDSLPSGEICEQLVKREDRPWPEYQGGKQITTRQMAKLLKPFQITPKKIRFPMAVKQGYERSAFDDAVERYLSVPEQPTKCSGNVPDRDSGKSLFDTVVPDVPDRGGGA